MALRHACRLATLAPVTAAQRCLAVIAALPLPAAAVSVLRHLYLSFSFLSNIPQRGKSLCSFCQLPSVLLLTVPTAA